MTTHRVCRASESIAQSMSDARHFRAVLLQVLIYVMPQSAMTDAH
jgi:hypothetical protein